MAVGPVPAPSAENDFERCFKASYRCLVGELTVVTTSRAEAEEAVQEAFGRLWRAWAQVSTYDNVEAWVRRVAINVATLGVLVRARALLRGQSRSLTVRYPSAFVRRIIGICGLEDLLGPSGQKNDDGAGHALGSWVAVPSSVPEHLPGHVGAAIDLSAHAVIVERAMSTTSKGPRMGGCD